MATTTAASLHECGSWILQPCLCQEHGVMSEPLKDEEICSLVESDLGSKFDSGFYSQAPFRKGSSFRQDMNRDDQSEVSAISGYHQTIDVARPSAGRIMSDSQVVGHHSIAHHGRRRRSSQPLPPCSVCKHSYPRTSRIKSMYLHPCL